MSSSCVVFLTVSNGVNGVCCHVHKGCPQVHKGCPHTCVTVSNGVCCHVHKGCPQVVLCSQRVFLMVFVVMFTKGVLTLCCYCF